jgi:protein required for attachment to host cells
LLYRNKETNGSKAMSGFRLTHAALVVVADGRKALFLINDGTPERPSLSVAEELHDDPNPPTRQQGADRPGRVHESAGMSRSGVETTDWHDVAEQRFLERVAIALDTFVRERGVRSLFLAAAPRALGQLRPHLSPAVNGVLAATFDKDLTRHPVSDIPKHLG